MQKEQVLNECTVVGNVIKLPNVHLERDVYLEVKKSLELIGGKWKGGKIAGFIFDSDPTDLFESIQSGEKRNLKKEYQFFETPKNLAMVLVHFAGIKEYDSILEPSAGQGAIIDCILEDIDKTNMVFYCEMMPTNQIILQRKYGEMENVFGIHPVNDDFLQLGEGTKFNKIIANPPFSKNQDIDHVRKMYNLLSPGGVLVSITSSHWEMSENKKEKEFRQWLKDVGAKDEDVPKNSFKDSGTLVGGKILIIRKPQ